MKTGKFFAAILQWWFERRVNREIFKRIFPHVRQETDHGFPFKDKAGLVRLHIRGNLQTSLDLELIAKAAGAMPTAYADAFRYIVYRDLNQRLEMYLMIAEKRIQPKDYEPHLVATHA